MRQRSFHFAEDAEPIIFRPEWPEYDDGMPLTPVAVEMAAFLAKELGIPFGDGHNDSPSADSHPHLRVVMEDRERENTWEDTVVDRSTQSKAWTGEAVWEEYDELITEWNRVRERRGDLLSNPPDSGSTSEQEWHDELDLLDRQQEILELALGACEVLVSAGEREQAEIAPCDPDLLRKRKESSSLDGE